MTCFRAVASLRRTTHHLRGSPKAQSAEAMRYTFDERIRLASDELRGPGVMKDLERLSVLRQPREPEEIQVHSSDEFSGRGHSFQHLLSGLCGPRESFGLHPLRVAILRTHDSVLRACR